MPGLDSFRDAYLARDWPVRRQSSPLGIAGALRGGMNGPSQLADWLDANVYDGARMDALTVGPRVILNATDLYNATPFAFTPLYFEGICGDLAQVRVADAVAASMRRQWRSALCWRKASPHAATALRPIGPPACWRIAPRRRSCAQRRGRS